MFRMFVGLVCAHQLKGFNWCRAANVRRSGSDHLGAEESGRRLVLVSCSGGGDGGGDCDGGGGGGGVGGGGGGDGDC